MDAQTSSNGKTNWSLGVALGAALAASACCTIPLALVSLGISGVWIGSLTALEPYRRLFVLFAMGALGYAGYNEWQVSRRPECDCETLFSSTTRRGLLGTGALAVVVLIVSPWLVAPSPSEATQQARVAATATEKSETSPPASFRQIVLTVEDMTCSACPATVRKALGEVEGVYNVEATYEPPEAVVRFDPKNTSVEALTRATKRAGFPSHPQSPSETP